MRDLPAIALMAFGAACIGLAADRFRADPLPLLYEPPPEAGPLDLPAFRDIVEHRVAGVILDARPADFYRMGHVPGAIGLSRERFQADYSRERERLEAGKSQIVAVYCADSGCDDAGIVARSLSRMRYSRVFVFKGGWEEWTAAHLPVQKAP